MATASTSIEIPHLKVDILVRDWRKSYLAAIALLEEKQKVVILPIYVTRSHGDQNWAHKAAEKNTIKEALDYLQLHLDGETSRLIKANEFFDLKPRDKEEPMNRAEISSFWFKVLDIGTNAEIGNDLMVLKFLQFVPHGHKVYEKLKENIKSDMSDENVTKVFDEIQKRISTVTHQQVVVKKESVFVNEEPVTEIIERMQKQIDDLKEEMGTNESRNQGFWENVTNSDSSDEEDSRSEGTVLFNRPKHKQDMFCSICKKTNHTAKCKVL